MINGFNGLGGSGVSHFFNFYFHVRFSPGATWTVFERRACELDARANNATVAGCLKSLESGDTTTGHIIRMNYMKRIQGNHRKHTLDTWLSVLV